MPAHQLVIGFAVGIFVSGASLSARVEQLSTIIVNGLQVIPAPGGVEVTPGKARVAGNDIQVTSPVHLAIDPPPSLQIEREHYHNVASTLPDRWGPGTHLRSTISGGTALPGSLEPGSLSLQLADGTPLSADQDYETEVKWAGFARREGGRITTDSEVVATYRVGQRRMDAVVLSPEGNVQVVQGRPDRVCPLVPDVTSGTLVIAHVYMPRFSTSVEPWQIFTVGTPLPEPDSSEIRRRAATVAGTLQKLKAGKPVSIVTWGDSVTVGGDASTPEKAYANLFITRLRERFPQAEITHTNAGIGGSTTDMRLPDLDRDVLQYKPDLVTIEFVNDMPFSCEKIRQNYAKAFEQIRQAGAEIIMITPHFTMPEWMGHPHPRGLETRPAVECLRRFAKEMNVPVSDTSKRWEHLESEGIPYEIFLRNGINHPDDRGHELFVKDLLSFFPADLK